MLLLCGGVNGLAILLLRSSGTQWRWSSSARLPLSYSVHRVVFPPSLGECHGYFAVYHWFPYPLFLFNFRLAEVDDLLRVLPYKSSD